MTGSSTHFVFDHKVFGVEGGYFSAAGRGGDACFNFPMGEITASVPIAALREEFGIAADSTDGRMLGLVEGALRHVKTIRVNDAIPNELLDGSASWSVEARHGAIARGRLALHLVAWVADKPAPAADLRAFVRSLETPEVQAKVREAIKRLTMRLGLAEGGVTEVERRLDALTHELSYLEALRERFGQIRELEAAFELAARACGNSLRVQDDAERVRVLLDHAFTRIGSQFELIDKQGENVARALAELPAQVALARAARDEIHRELMAWDEIAAAWRGFAEGTSERSAPAMVEATYRFLARNYPIAQVW